MILMAAHCGTHNGVPRHFVEDGLAVDQWPLEKPILPGHLLDLTHKGLREPMRDGTASPVRPLALVMYGRLPPRLRLQLALVALATLSSVDGLLGVQRSRAWRSWPKACTVPKGAHSVEDTC
jgi:putative cyclase